MRIAAPRRLFALCAAGALAASAALAAASAAPTAAPAAIDSDLLAGFKARNIGPAGMSGRVAVIDGVNSNPDVLYVGAATGGVWKSTNGGLTWAPIFDDQPVHAIGSIAVVQSNPDVVWVGTGEGNVRNSASVGEGIFKTTDGGRTWTRMGLEKTERIYRILVNPRDENEVWACAMGREWGENPERGVFRTTDGGKSWTRALYVDEKTGCGELALDPHNPDRLIAGMWQFRRWPWFFKSGGPGSAMYTSADGGTTWKKMQEEDGLPAGELGRMGIAFAASEPGVVYALVEAKKSALLRSDDAGGTWKTVSDRDNIAVRPFYFDDIRVDPNDSRRLYSLHYTVDISEDGGKSWSGLRGMRAIHGDMQAMWIDPNDPRHLWVGDDGGIAESRDRGATFRFVANLPLAQFYHVQVDNDLPYHVYGGLQDNGSWRGPSSLWQEGGGIINSEWVVVGGGDGFETVPHPKDSSIVYAESQGGELQRADIRTGEYRGVKPAAPEGVTLRFNWNAALAVDPFEPDTVYLGSQFVHKSTDRGASWTTISPDLTTNNPEWQKADESGGLTLDASRAENHTTLLQIVPSPVEHGVIWTGSDDGRVHVTRDGGKTWTSVEKNVPGVPANTWVPHIRASTYAGGTAFAVFDNHRRSDWTPYVLRTDDYGKTWTSLATSDLRGYALSIEQDPVKKDLLFLGTEFGLYVSLDGGHKWTQLKKTLPTASVMDLVIHPRDHDLVIATHGRALWILDDIRPFRELSAAALAEPLHFYPPGPAQQSWNRPPVAGFGLGAGDYNGENRDYGAILTYSLNGPGLSLQDDEKERARKEQERVAEAAKEAKAAQDEPKAKAGEAKPPAAAKSSEAAETKPAEAAKKKDEKPPQKVEITVSDAAGKVVRTFKGPAKLGVNRVVWNLGSNAFKAQPQGDNPRGRGGDDDDRSGPEVPPGTYTVTIKFGEQSAKQTVVVVPDGRSKNTAADWTARAAAVEELRGLADALTDAIWRLRRTRDDIASVQAKARQAAQDAGEKDPKKLGDLPLVKDGGKLVEKLDALEKKMWQTPEGIGIRPDIDAQSTLYGAFDIQSSWAPPTPNDRAKLVLGRHAVQGVVDELNKLFAGDVAAYRKKAEEAKTGLFSSASEVKLPAAN